MVAGPILECEEQQGHHISLLRSISQISSLRIASQFYICYTSGQTFRNVVLYFMLLNSDQYPLQRQTNRPLFQLCTGTESFKLSRAPCFHENIKIRSFTSIGKCEKFDSAFTDNMTKFLSHIHVPPKITNVNQGFVNRNDEGNTYRKKEFLILCDINIFELVNFDEQSKLTRIKSNELDF